MPDDHATDDALFREMIETVGVGVAIYAVDGQYRYVNEAYADLLETDRESLVGTAVWEVNPALDREGFERYWDSFSEGETKTAEAEHAFGGTRVPVATIETRRRIDGTPYNFGTIRDITERKRREEELRRQNERLDSFVGIVSHDLRNPLSVAKAYLDTVREDVSHDELTMVDSALDRMDILIEDLLTLARKGSTVEDPRPLSLRGIATAAWRSVDTGVATLDVNDDPLVLADESRLQQLLENLFRNAVEHSTPDRESAFDDGDAGSAADLTVTVGILEDESGFYVADDGPGVPADQRESVFDAGETSRDGGTGFGLAIVKGIAESHDWTVSLTESASGGARFDFSGVEFAER